MGVDVAEATVDETGAFLTAGRTSMSVAEQYEFDRNVSSLAVHGLSLSLPTGILLRKPVLYLAEGCAPCRCAAALAGCQRCAAAALRATLTAPPPHSHRSLSCQGYLVLRDFMTAEETAALRGATNKLEGNSSAKIAEFSIENVEKACSLRPSGLENSARFAVGQRTPTPSSHPTAPPRRRTSLRRGVA